MADPNMLFDLSIKDSDIVDVLDDFFRQAGRPFVIDDDLSGVITVHAADVGFQDALELVLPEGFIAVEDGDVYHIRRVPKAA